MEHKKEIFADGIGQIHFAGGMVRFDFVTLQPNENGAAPTPVVNERIIMPPQGFLGAFNSMQQLIDIADTGNIMPPKTTWFEPKLRSGVVIHSFAEEKK